MRMRRWSVALVLGLVVSLLATPVTGHEGEDGTGGNNLSTPVIFAEGFGLSGIAVDPEVITSTGMPGLLKSHRPPGALLPGRGADMLSLRSRAAGDRRCTAEARTVERIIRVFDLDEDDAAVLREGAVP